jgi:GTP-binding protein HflX
LGATTEFQDLHRQDALQQKQQRALLVGVALPQTPMWEVEESLNELGRLASTATIEEADRILQSRKRIDSRCYIGKGKAADLKSRAKAVGADMIIFDNDLSPAQMRNLEELADMRILDRSGLILDIFARHARTRTAQIQVELAQLNYLVPRLTRQWSHLSRQAGGGAIRGMGAAGVRGPGETQLETDRRMIRKRIGVLSGKLARIGRQMAVSRKNRSDVYKIALVGYTNAGKSTLMRALSGADVVVEDQLFATLDSTTRVVEIDRQHRFLLTDTVGFIRHLPHHLFASFRATLEEAVSADLLLHVIDLSHPHYDLQRETVEEVLRDLSIEDKPILTVLNKIDQVGDNEEEEVARGVAGQEDVVAVSALTGYGLDALKSEIMKRCEADSVTLDLHIPQGEGKLLATLRARTQVLEQDYLDNKVHLRVRLDKGDADRWKLSRFAFA